MRPQEIIAAADALGVAVSSEQAERLRRYASLLGELGVSIGVMSDRDADRLFERHILDCLRASVAVLGRDRAAYDLGSGGGLPGVVVAICCPTLEVVLVESRRRRAAFLELVVERLALANASVTLARIETLQAPVDLCFARALAPLGRAWPLARPLLRPGGRLVYFAGKGDGIVREGGLPGDVEASHVEVIPGRLLESAGPLVIMTR